MANGVHTLATDNTDTQSTVIVALGG